jgi:hypothetical protein
VPDRTWRKIHDRQHTRQTTCTTDNMHDRQDTRQTRYTTDKIHDRQDTRQTRYTTDKIHDRQDTRQTTCRTDNMQDRQHAGQTTYRTGRGSWHSTQRAWKTVSRPRGPMRALNSDTLIFWLSSSMTSSRVMRRSSSCGPSVLPSRCDPPQHV